MKEYRFKYNKDGQQNVYSTFCSNDGIARKRFNIRYGHNTVLESINIIDSKTNKLKEYEFTYSIRNFTRSLKIQSDTIENSIMMFKVMYPKLKFSSVRELI
jgi:hypothetical protein